MSRADLAGTREEVSEAILRADEVARRPSPIPLLRRGALMSPYRSAVPTFVGLDGDDLFTLACFGHCIHLLPGPVAQALEGMPGLGVVTWPSLGGRRAVLALSYHS